MHGRDTNGASALVSGHDVASMARRVGPSGPCLSQIQRALPDDPQDLICVGFGPASLAIAVALQDTLSSSGSGPTLPGFRHRLPRVIFLERQTTFAWHAGMLLPGAKMQISFVKDLATLRNPRSEFTFLNYLHKNNRLVQFTNLGTFLPLRLEYEDYMRWCATAFRDAVEYGQEVVDVQTGSVDSNTGKVKSFVVRSRVLASGEIISRTARHVVIAVGGKPHIPSNMPKENPRLLHSSQYSTAIPSLLKDINHPYRIAVVGSGQSAAEIFNDLQSKFPNAKTTLIIKGAALRPSDDSPFVNEIFDPDRVDTVFRQSAKERKAAIELDRGTNYGVVRLELLEHIYASMYAQRLMEPNENLWQHRILSNRIVERIVEDGAYTGREQSLGVCIGDFKKSTKQDPNDSGEMLYVDAVILATGYKRDAHDDLLQPIQSLKGKTREQGIEDRWCVGRDYRVQLDPTRVDSNAGIWLQGCNENTHGLSDTLLSILATRGGELVDSIFGPFEDAGDVNGSTDGVGT